MKETPKAPPRPARTAAGAPRAAVAPTKDSRPHAEKQAKPQEQFEVTKAGLLAHNAAYSARPAPSLRALGGTPPLGSRPGAVAASFSHTPRTGEIVARGDGPALGEPLTELLPSARMRGRVRPDPGIASGAPPRYLPPPFLSPLEAMTDVYMHTRGRASPRARELLGGSALEDLIALLQGLHADEARLARREARLDGAFWARFEDGSGPIVLGFGDPRLREPWRLFLEEWDVWSPQTGDGSGVELFWEGEAEGEDGRPIDLLESLTYQRGEATLYARMGDLQDRITFDGETFFRLQTELATSRPPAR